MSHGGSSKRAHRRRIQAARQKQAKRQRKTTSDTSRQDHSR